MRAEQILASAGLVLPLLGGGGAGAGATAWGWGNGLGAVITTSRWPAGLLRGALIPGASRAREVGHVCVCAGHRLAALSASLRSFVRIYTSDQCPRQDSNLRSRLPRPIPFTTATWQNAPSRPDWGAYGVRAAGGWVGAKAPWCSG